MSLSLHCFIASIRLRLRPESEQIVYRTARTCANRGDRARLGPRPWIWSGSQRRAQADIGSIAVHRFSLILVCSSPTAAPRHACHKSASSDFCTVCFRCASGVLPDRHPPDARSQGGTSNMLILRQLFGRSGGIRTHKPQSPDRGPPGCDREGACPGSNAEVRRLSTARFVWTKF
jgi:hypothetical protein